MKLSQSVFVLTLSVSSAVAFGLTTPLTKVSGLAGPMSPLNRDTSPLVQTVQSSDTSLYSDAAATDVLNKPRGGGALGGEIYCMLCSCVFIDLILTTSSTLACYKNRSPLTQALTSPSSHTSSSGTSATTTTTSPTNSPLRPPAVRLAFP